MIRSALLIAVLAVGAAALVLPGRHGLARRPPIRRTRSSRFATREGAYFAWLMETG